MNITGKLLIVDDEQVIRHTLARILQSSGFDVTTAENAEQGLAFLETSSFDLVFMDIRLPGMPGLDALDIIRSRYSGLPVVLFTALPDLDSAVEALRRGATDYLLKPLKPEMVIDRIRSILLARQKERRKREIQAQIDLLQGELNQLNDESAVLPPPSSPPPLSSERYLKRGDIALDLYTRRVTVGENIISLLPTSFNFLLVLARHAPEVVDYQTLVAEAQGYKVDVREAQELVKWHIHQIRQAIEPDVRKPRYIFNVRGMGYRLVSD
ncbi:MAG TPA: response regulator transcription factor [Anaerolineaceae bacterium]|jgi:DNA-binding response OmpR family regulator|nr:response regulator transcription factor [Anaerolineaceae bacterium]